MHFNFEISRNDCIFFLAGCDYRGSLYSSGQRFPDPGDRCRVCTCLEGTVTCNERVACPDLGSCQSVATFEGECCPYCQDCGGRASGETWYETPCQKCTCVVSVRGTDLCRNIVRF